MKSMKKTILKLTLSLVLTFGLIASLPYNQSSAVAKETTSNSTVDIDTTTNYNADNTEASIIFDVDSFKHTIVNVKDLNDQIIQVGTNHEYVVAENKAYNFTITYTDENNTEKSFVKTVTIDKIGTNGTNSANAWRSPLLRSSVKSGGAEISIPEYDGIGWEAKIGNMQTKKVAKFTVDFGDTSTSGKKVRITIPEGMTIETISVIGSKNNYTGVNKNILIEYPSNHPVATSLTSMNIPKPDAFNATYGEVSYEFINSIQIATIDITLAIDNRKYYGAHTLKEPIKLEVEKEGNVIGKAEQSISAVGKSTLEGTSLAYFQNNLGDYNLPTSTDENNLVAGRTHGPIFNTASGIYYGMNNIEYYAHYPVEMEFDYANYKNNGGNVEVIEVDEEKGEVVYKKTSTSPFYEIYSNLLYINYKVPFGTAPGKYKVKEADYIKHIAYDGTVITKTVINTAYNVNILEELRNQFDVVGTGYSDFDNTTLVSEHNHYTGVMGLRNTSGGMLTNQVFEMTVEPDFMATSVFMPKGNDEPKNIVYKTNLNSNERLYSGEVPVFVNTSLADPSPSSQSEVSKDLLGLDSNEYITYIRADIGSFNKGWQTNVNAHGIGSRVVLYGRLNNGSSGAKLQYNIYDKNNQEKYTTTQISTIKYEGPKEVRLQAGGGFSPSKINAGEQFTTSGLLRIDEYYNSTGYGSQIVLDPVIYIIQNKGLEPLVDEMILKDQSGNNVNFTFSSRVLEDGRILYKVNPDFEYITNFVGENTKTKEARYLSYSYKTKTKISNQAVTIDSGVTFWTSESENIENALHGQLSSDDMDLDQDGNTAELLLRSVNSGASLQIIKNNNVLVETGLSVEGEPSLPSYEVGDEDTIARFSPGTNADLKVDVLNNDDVPANDTTVYIPIPKTGVDFGDHFQTEAFTWDMKLRAAVPAVNGTEVSYSTDSAPGKYMDGQATYSTTLPANLSDVTMVKITSTAPIPVNAKATFHVPLVVDETFESATSEDKVGKLNVFYPAYYVDSANYAGRLSGTTVATELIISSIGGTIFEDMDANGLYDASVDELMPNQTVELYHLNETTGAYEAYMKDGEHLTATSDANGVYEFHSDLNIPKGTYAIKFIEKAGSVYQYTKQNVSDAAGDELIDSDAIMFNDIPNPGDTYRGWVLDIDATRAEAKTIGVGFLQYDPPADLKVSINDEPNEVKVGETITVGTVISPTFFDEIKHPDTPYTWKIVGGATEEAKATLINNNDGTVTIVPSDSITGTTTIDIEITIMGIYGGVATSEIATITIISDTPPTISAEDVTTYVGNPISDILANANVTAVDNAGNDLAVVFTAGALMNASYTNTAPNDGSVFTKPGTYTVTYSVTDKWGNVGTLDKLVKVNEGPTVTSYGAQYVLGTPEADILAGIENDVNASWLKAPDAVGDAVATVIAAPANTTGGNDTIKYELDATNPSSDFSVAGIYKVNYTATNPDGKTATTTKYILITTTDVTPNEAGLMISAVGFSVEQEDKAAFTEAISKDADHGKVEAYKAVTDADGNVTSYVDLTADATLKTSDVVGKVNNAPATGGIYPATYEIKDADGSAEVTIAIVVNGTNIVTENGITIYADSFVIENAEAASMDDAKVVSHGNVVAIRNEDSSFITDITSDSAQLDVIKAVNAGGGIFPLTVTANDTDDSVSKDIKVTVKGYNVNVENGISIYAESFRIPNAEAAGLDSDLALSTSNAHAINSVTGVELTDLTVNEDELAAINAATSRGGIFKLTVYASEDDRTAAKVIYVTVDGTQVNVGDLTITAEGFNVGQGDAKLLDEEKAKELSHVFAVDTATGQPVTDIKANPEDIKNINNDDGTGGVYELTFTATNEAGDTVSITVYVTVEGSNVTVLNGIAIEAYGFTVPYAESLTLTRDCILERGKVKSWYVVDYTMIEEIDINLDHLSSIHAGPKSGGLYDVEAKVEVDSATSRSADKVASMVPVTVIGEEEVVVDPGTDLATTGFNASALLFSIVLTAILGLILILKRRKTIN